MVNRLSVLDFDKSACGAAYVLQIEHSVIEFDFSVVATDTFV